MYHIPVTKRGAITMGGFVAMIMLIMIPLSSVLGQNEEWCVASPDATNSALQEAIDWACSSQGGADCSTIQPGGPCFEPNTLIDHASVAFNDYWQHFKASGGTCDFKGSAVLVNANPSHEPCNFTLL